MVGSLFGRWWSGVTSTFINLFEIKTPQVGFCILNCNFPGFEKEKTKEKEGKEKEKELEEEERKEDRDKSKFRKKNSNYR